MNWDSISKIAIAFSGVVAAWLQLRRGRGGGRRAQLQRDLDLLALLPEDSTARAALSQHVDAAVVSLIRDEAELRRDPTGIVLGLVLVGAAAAGVIGAVLNRGWWWALLVPAVFLGLIGVLGFVQDVVPRKRDDKGKVIE